MSVACEARLSETAQAKTEGDKTMKIWSFKSGAYVALERVSPSGMYIVTVRNPSGDVHDKIKCDDRRMALEYVKAFKKIAKNL